MRKPVAGYAVLIALLVLTSFFSINLFFKEKTSHDKVSISAFPRVVGNWKGTDMKLTEKEYDILETRNLISREYVNPKNEKLYLFVIYSETNRSVFHPPEVCLIGSGVEIADKNTEKIRSGRSEFLTNKLNVQKGDTKEIVLYSYKAGNLYTNNFYFQQAYLALHQIFGRQVPGATIRVSMQVKGDEKATLATLKDFLAKTAALVGSLK